MTGSVLMQAQEGRVRFMKETITGRPRLQTLDVEDLVRLALAMPAELETAWLSLRARIEKDEAGDLDAVGEQLRRQYDQAAEVMGEVLRLASDQGLPGEDL